MPLDFENIIALVEEVLQEKSKSEGTEQPMPKWLRSLTTDAGDVDKEFRRRQKHDTNKARSDKAALDRWQNLVTKPREQMAAKAMRDLQNRPDRIKSSEMPKKRPSAQDIRSMDAQEKLKATQRREREDIELKNIFKQLDKERALTRKSVGAFPKVATDAERKTTAARKKLKSMQDQARWDIGKRKNLAKLKNQLSTLQKYYPNSQAREEAEEKLEIFRANLAPWESPKRVYDKKTELSTEPYSFEKGLPPEAGSAATAAMVTGKPEWAQGHLEPHSFEPRHAYKGVDWFLTSPLPAPEGGETKEEKEEREQTNRERAEERYQRWGIKPGSPEAADAPDSVTSQTAGSELAPEHMEPDPDVDPSLLTPEDLEVWKAVEREEEEEPLALDKYKETPHDDPKQIAKIYLEQQARKKPPCKRGGVWIKTQCHNLINPYYVLMDAVGEAFEQITDGTNKFEVYDEAKEEWTTENAREVYDRYADEHAVKGTNVHGVPYHVTPLTSMIIEDIAHPDVMNEKMKAFYLRDKESLIAAGVPEGDIVPFSNRWKEEAIEKIKKKYNARTKVLQARYPEKLAVTDKVPDIPVVGDPGAEEETETTQIPEELLKNIVNGGSKRIPGIEPNVKIVPTGIVTGEGKRRRVYEIQRAGLLKYATEWVKLRNMHLTTKGGLFIEVAAKLNWLGGREVGEKELERLEKREVIRE